MKRENKVKEVFLKKRRKIGSDIVDTIRTGIYMTDNNGVISFANRAFAEIFQYSDENEVIGLSIKDELYEIQNDRNSFLQVMQEKGFVADYMIRMVRKDGSQVIISARSNFIKDDKGEVVGVEGVLREIAEPLESQGISIDEISQMGTHDEAVCKELELLMRDPLTGTYNYQYFMKVLDLEIKRANRFFRQLSLMMMEIDKYDEKYSSGEGVEKNTVIKEISKLLGEKLRDTDILCRQSGSQFVIILPETNRPEALELAKKVKDAMQEYFEDDKLTCSIGMSRFINGMTMQEFILKVNLGLYMAKEQGGNEACFYG